MYVINSETRKQHAIEIIPIEKSDYRIIPKSKFWFDWKQESSFEVYKLVLKENQEILGLVSLNRFGKESRIKIRLLAASKENRGKNKKYDRITGNLLAFAGIESIKAYGAMACISLIPKTALISHYEEKYSMLQAGKSMFLEGMALLALINEYDHE